MNKEFREQEFSIKLGFAAKTRSRGYKDEIIDDRDLVCYQVQNKKAWLGPVKIISIQGNSIFLHTNSSMSKVPKCNVKFYKSIQEGAELK